MHSKISISVKAMTATALLSAATGASAAYPKSMEVGIELWNHANTELALASASWMPKNADLSVYTVPANVRTSAAQIVLNNARNDSATFRLRGGDKTCEFKLAHEVTFSWISINPAPQKSASAASVGKVAAECGASVVSGADSMKTYTVRFVMK